MLRQLTHHSTIDFKMLVEKLEECVWIYDLNTKKFLYVSPSIYQLRGLTVEEAMQEKLEDCLTPESLQKLKNGFLRRYQRFLEGDRSDSIVYNLSEFQQYCKDGSIKYIEISTRLEIDEPTNHILGIGVSRDINKRKLHEKKLVETIRNQYKIINKKKSTKKSDPELYVYLFGKYRVLTGLKEKPIKWRTTKTEELFAFLLQNENQFISKDELLEALWPDVELEKATRYLHTTIYNLKNNLKTANITFNLEVVNGLYCYEKHHFYSDLGEFKNMINDAVNPYNEIDAASARNIERAILLYEGDLLAENDYPWATSQSTFYRHRFEKYVFALARHYFFKRDYLSTKRVLYKLIEMDNLNERYHELLLNVFRFDDDYVAFTRHYEDLKALLLKELDQPPNPSIQALYQQYRDDAEASFKNERAHF
ncbi:BTAD domain-containing putative transcriptional regulator [Acetobacterium fimetarium]|nr:BTAD domain-containing putative transcriptional regulator [Acetobacterium fimetarium]